MNKLLMMACMACVLVGCSTGPRGTKFAVEVMNITSMPLSAGLVKTRGAPEEGWTTPAEAAINAAELGDRHWGMLIRPGETVVIGPQEGHIEQGAAAMLRVYGGNLTINELIGMGRNDPDRVDVFLPAGNSSYVIAIRDGRLVAVRSQEYRSTATRPTGERVR